MSPGKVKVIISSIGIRLHSACPCRFVSYLAPTSRWDIALECLPEDDSDVEDGNQS
jgi:hypothetical protein